MDHDPSTPGSPSADTSHPVPASNVPEKETDRRLREMDRLVRLVSEQNARLQRLLVGVAVAFMLLSFGTGIFFFKQMRMARQQLAVHRQSATSSLRDFRSRIEPDIYSLAGQLQDFAATNPDFRPILDPFQPVLAPYFTSRGSPNGSSGTPNNSGTSGN